LSSEIIVTGSCDSIFLSSPSQDLSSPYHIGQMAAPPLPSSHSQFSSAAYWDSAFASNPNQFEWYGSTQDILPFMITKSAAASSSSSTSTNNNINKTLVLGCGNSSLSNDLVSVKFSSDITSLDFSQVVIDQMKRKYPDPKLNWVLGDMLALPDDWRSTFNVVMDKGALDALIAEDSPTALSQAQTLFSEIRKVLAPNGTYYLVSLLQSHILRAVMQEWSHVEVFPFDPLSGSSMQPFIVKLKLVVPVLSLANVRLESSAEVAEAVFQTQKSFIAKRELNKPNSKPGIRAQFSLGHKDRFHLTVIDSCTAKPDMHVACLIVPQGRELDYNIGSEIGQVDLASSNNIGRLILVTLGRDNEFESLQKVQNELSPIILQLAPKQLPAGYAIPFLAVAPDLGKRTQIAQGQSEKSGAFVVEDVLLDDGVVQRRLVFLNDPLAIQSEVVLDAQGAPDPSQLIFELHQAMVSCLDMIKPIAPVRFLVVGLGGGSLTSYLRLKYPEAAIESVEWDAQLVPVATQWFGFKADSVQVYVGDGLDYLAKQRSEEHRLDVLFIDVDSKDMTSAIQFPPFAFLNAAQLVRYRDVLLKSQTGVLSVNFAAREEASRTEFLKKVKTVFSHVYVFIMSDFGDSNLILIAWGHADNPTAQEPVSTSMINAEVKDSLRWINMQGEYLTVQVGETGSTNATKKKKRKSKSKSKKNS